MKDTTPDYPFADDPDVDLEVERRLEEAHWDLGPEEVDLGW